MLAQVPAFRGGLGQTYTLYFGSSRSKSLCVEAYSTWHITDNASCDLLGKEKTIPGLIQIGIQSPVRCTFAGLGFRRWVGTTDEERNRPGYLGILALGWSYILSARSVEMQDEGAEIMYTNSIAPGFHHEIKPRRAQAVTVDIGDVDGKVARWWAAIMAPGEGWKAVVSRKDSVEYLAPWSVSREGTHDVGIKWRTNGPVPKGSEAYEPPSSREAFDFLARFSLLYDLGSQFLVALATAITFPAHKNHGTMVELPLPGETKVKQKCSLVDSIAPDWISVNKELPYYMALSCNPEVVISSLCGMFWEENVPSNMVSPWLHPILYEVPEAKEIMEDPGFYHEILAIMCSFRRPRISALWLGAVAGGLTPIILRRVRSGRPPLDANAFPWTGSPQSFMDLAGSGAYVRETSADKVQREDVWRLLYLPPVVEDDLSYNSPPFTPWPPPGNTPTKNCALRVVTHLQCPRHKLEYRHWNWKLKDGSVFEDRGLESYAAEKDWEQPSPKIEPIASVEFPGKLVDQEASQEASHDIFRWVTVNGEGVPPEAVYKDDWVRIEDDSDEESDAADDADSVSRVRNDGLKEWLEGVIESPPTAP